MTLSLLLTRAHAIMTDKKESEEIVTATTQPIILTHLQTVMSLATDVMDSIILPKTANIDVKKREIIWCKHHE